MSILDDVEIATVQAKINSLHNGVYEVSEIFGDDWVDMPDKYGYGRRFLQTVIGGFLRNIRYHDRLLDNHRTYEIFGRP